MSEFLGGMMIGAVIGAVVTNLTKPTETKSDWQDEKAAKIQRIADRFATLTPEQQQQVVRTGMWPKIPT